LIWILVYRSFTFCVSHVRSHWFHLVPVWFTHHLRLHTWFSRGSPRSHAHCTPPHSLPYRTRTCHTLHTPASLQFTTHCTTHCTAHAPRLHTTHTWFTATTPPHTLPPPRLGLPAFSLPLHAGLDHGLVPTTHHLATAFTLRLHLYLTVCLPHYRFTTSRTTTHTLPLWIPAFHHTHTHTPPCTPPLTYTCTHTTTTWVYLSLSAPLFRWFWIHVSCIFLGYSSLQFYTGLVHTSYTCWVLHLPHCLTTTHMGSLVLPHIHTTYHYVSHCTTVCTHVLDYCTTVHATTAPHAVLVGSPHTVPLFLTYYVFGLHLPLRLLPHYHHYLDAHAPGSLDLRIWLPPLSHMPLRTALVLRLLWVCLTPALLSSPRLLAHAPQFISLLKASPAPRTAGCCLSAICYCASLPAGSLAAVWFTRFHCIFTHYYAPLVSHCTHTSTVPLLPPGLVLTLGLHTLVLA